MCNGIVLRGRGFRKISGFKVSRLGFKSSFEPRSTARLVEVAAVAVILIAVSVLWAAGWVVGIAGSAGEGGRVTGLGLGLGSGLGLGLDLGVGVAEAAEKAAEKAAPAAPEKTATEKAGDKTVTAGKAREKVQIRADRRGDYDLEKGVLVLEGNVVITQGETVIKADRVEIDMNKKIARVTTGVNLTQTDLVLTGKTFTAYLNDKRVIVEGGVVLQKDEEQASIKQAADTAEGVGKAGTTGTGGKGEGLKSGSKGEAGGKKKDRITLRCDRLEYWTEKKESTATGNVVVTKGETKAWGDKAVYREKDKLFTLTGKVRVERGDGETMACEELTMLTDRDAVTAKNNVEIEFETD